MIMTHVFLLNVLIAVMSRAMALESKEAKLVACYRQCVLVLEEEVEDEAHELRHHGANYSRDLYPKWIHVLLPVEHSLDLDGLDDAAQAPADTAASHSGSDSSDGRNSRADLSVKDELRMLRATMLGIQATLQQQRQQQ